MKFSTILAIPFAIAFANAAAAPAVTAAPAPADNPYTIYPPVPKTASINGFADRIYDQIPKCAQECVSKVPALLLVHTGIPVAVCYP